MNTLQKQFSDALKREKKFVTTYYNNETVPCLFRRLEDNKNTTNYIQIFYSVDSPIKQGQIITYGGKNFITLNQETVENNVYYKSSLIECNTTLEIVVNQRMQHIPCYAGDLLSPGLVVSNTISVVDGNIELITESTDDVNAIKFDTAFKILGGTYEIINRYIKSGLTYLYVQRTTSIPEKEPVFEVELTSDAQYEMDTTTTLTPVATIDGVLDDDAIFTWSSSDKTIATVDEDGLVTFIGAGNVTITVEYNGVTDRVHILVVDAPPAEAFTLSLSATKNYLWIEDSVTITATLKDSSGSVVDFVPVWTFAITDNYDGEIEKLTITGTATKVVKVSTPDDWSLLGETVTVTCTTSDGLSSASMDFEIVFQ